MKKTVIIILIYLFLSTTLQAGETTFTSNTVISAGDVYDVVFIRGDSTVVTMTGGDVNDIYTLNASTFNMTGGNAGTIYCYNTAFTISLNYAYGYIVVYDGTFPSGFSASNMPDPMTWLMPPAAISSTSITMTASTATDPCGVEYFFTNTTIGSHDSGWQDSSTYIDTGLAELTQYTYQVKVRDKSPSQNETAYSGGVSATTTDGTAPTPDPMTWAIAPAAAGLTSITMTATTATDASGVEYYFTCTAGGGNDSGWQGGTTYTDTGLSPNTQYTYTVTASDNSSNQNTTAASAPASATTNADTTAPSPDPMTWATAPYAASDTSISMTATTATDDASGVEYYFTCTAGGGNDSAWQNSTTYTDTGLNPATQYTYTVKARDKSANQNTTTASAPVSATTDALPAIILPDPVAYWSLDDNGASTTVLDSSGNGNNGTATVNTSILSVPGQVNTCFDFAGTDYVTVPDNDALSFGNGTVDRPFSIAAWVFVTRTGTFQVIASKWDTNDKEWSLILQDADKIIMTLTDESAGVSAQKSTQDALTAGWHFIVVTYNGENGSWSGATAANFITIYIDSVSVAVHTTNNANYAGMENKTANLALGARYTSGVLSDYYNDKIDNVKIFSECLTTTEITVLYNE